MYNFAAAGFQSKIAALPANGHHVRIPCHLDTKCLGILQPAGKDILSRTGIEWQTATQRQKARLCHDVFAFLVTLDGIGEVRGAFQQHMRQAQFGSATRGAEASRPGANDDYFKAVFHNSPATCPCQRLSDA